MDLASFFQNLILRSNLNLLDLIIFIVFALYALEGFEVGFIVAFFDLLSFIISFVTGLKFYSFLGSLLAEIFSMPHGTANALGFFIIAFVVEVVLGLLLHKVFRGFMMYISARYAYQDATETNFAHAILRSINRFFGLLPGIASAYILFSFLLTVIVSFPFSPFLKNIVLSSKMGGFMVSKTHIFENKISEVFGGALNDTLNFLTVEPHSESFVSLNFKATVVSVDSEAERQMFNLINKERKEAGVSTLVFGEALRNVARGHSEDMLRRGYFSHYSPEGISPFDRMAKADISYVFAGENLALAPDTDLAMQGLMNSPGHKANILSKDFRRVGIGVIDGGVYGKMFSQEFTD